MALYGEPKFEVRSKMHVKRHKIASCAVFKFVSDRTSNSCIAGLGGSSDAHLTAW